MVEKYRQTDGEFTSVASHIAFAAVPTGKRCFGDGGGGGWRWDGGDVGSGKGPARARDTALQPLQHGPLSVRQLVGAVLEGDAAPGGGLDAEASAAEGRTVMKEAYESGIQPWCQKLLWTQGKGGLLTPPTR